VLSVPDYPDHEASTEPHVAHVIPGRGLAPVARCLRGHVAVYGGAAMGSSVRTPVRPGVRGVSGRDRGERTQPDRGAVLAVGSIGPRMVRTGRSALVRGAAHPRRCLPPSRRRGSDRMGGSAMARGWLLRRTGAGWGRTAPGSARARGWKLSSDPRMHAKQGSARAQRVGVHRRPARDHCAARGLRRSGASPGAVGRRRGGEHGSSGAAHFGRALLGVPTSPFGLDRGSLGSEGSRPGAQ